MPKALSTNRQRGNTVVTQAWIHIYREPQLKKSSQEITEKKRSIGRGRSPKRRFRARRRKKTSGKKAESEISSSRDSSAFVPRLTARDAQRNCKRESGNLKAILQAKVQFLEKF